jgi:predicted nucleotidyltransferase
MVYTRAFLSYILAMIHESHIRQVAVQLANAAHASRVILFGSYARGEATDRSDVDLMVVAETDLPRHKRAINLYKQFRPYPFGMDIVVYTPQEIEEGKKSALTFVSAVLREGKTLYERPDGTGPPVAGQSTE